MKVNTKIGKKLMLFFSITLALILVGLIEWRNSLSEISTNVFFSIVSETIGICIFSVYIFACITNHDILYSQYDKYFAPVLLCFSLTFFTDAISCLLEGIPSDVTDTYCYFFDSFTYLGNVMSMYLFVLMTHEILYGDWKKIRFLLHIVKTYFIILALVLVLNYRFGFFFSYEDGVYVAGPMIFLTSVVPEVILIVYCSIIIHKKMDSVEKVALLLHSILPFSAMIAQTFFPVFPFEVTAIVVSCSMLFAWGYMRRGSLLAEERMKLQKDKAALMISQIQPHFLYNTLSSIVSLCDIDSKKAKKVVIEFSDYLRGNLDAMGQTSLIPFEKELEHTKTYLNIELIRFADSLKIEYDIKSVGFELPPLSLQPLVENAVKHGVGNRESGGIVSVSVSENDSSFTVSVEDNGVGFDTAKLTANDETTGIGIENVRFRLQSLCHGDLSVSSEIGKGTKAVITIPKKIAN